MTDDSRVLLACSMIEPEIKKSLCDHNLDFPVVWLDSGLHDKPDLLRTTIQQEIDRHQDCRQIFLGYCLCGNSVIGLTGGRASLLLPKFDDCVHMLMTTEQGKNSGVLPDCLYYTGGWMDGGSSLLQDLDRYIEKYGEKKARRAIALMYNNYRGIRMIETGAYNVEKYRGRAEEKAISLGLDLDVCPGTIRIINKLLSGQWDEEIIIIPPGQKIKDEHFYGRTL